MPIPIRLIIAGLALMPAPAFAQYGGAAPQTPIFSGSAGGGIAGQPYQMKIAVLEAHARKLSAQDGGTLTPAHLAALQTRLDRINADEIARGR
jgi:hypothetical protein